MEPDENSEVAVEEQDAQLQEETDAQVVVEPVVAHEVSAAPAPAEAVTLQINEVPTAGREYPSLYDTKGTTVVAILLGISIVAAIQFGIVRMYTTAKSEQIYLTRFVTALVGLVMGAYIADLLIAGPSTNLLSDEDHTMILSFVKDIALMIFAYYFGTKSRVQGQDGEGA
jgi:hypothetical protein